MVNVSFIVSFQLIEYESMLEEQFQTIAGGDGISPDDYVLLLLLYNEALGELRTTSQGQEQETIINNFRQKFYTKRSIIEQVKYTKLLKVTMYFFFTNSICIRDNLYLILPCSH